MSELVFDYCAALVLNVSVVLCSQHIGHHATRLLSLIGRSEVSIAAASVYLASHLRSQPKTLSDIAQATGATEGAIHAVYRRLYAHHHHMPAPIRREIFGASPGHAFAEDVQSSNVSTLSASFFLHSPFLRHKKRLRNTTDSYSINRSYEPEISSREEKLTQDSNSGLSSSQNTFAAKIARTKHSSMPSGPDSPSSSISSPPSQTWQNKWQSRWRFIPHSHHATPNF